MSSVDMYLYLLAERGKHTIIPARLEYTCSRPPLLSQVWDTAGQEKFAVLREGY